jgi:pyruvate kinase
MNLHPPQEWRRRTCIVATLGPATSDSSRIRAVLEAGVNVVRLNFSHGEASEHARICGLVRDTERHLGRPVAVMQDLAGPKIRVGHLHNGAVTLRDGQRLTLTATDRPGTDHEVSINYPQLPRDVRAGNRILLDDGNLELVVEATTASSVTTRVVRGGVLKEHKGVNLPGVSLDVPSLTAKDLTDLEFGLQQLGVDYVALSFVRRARDITLAREAMDKIGIGVPIIAKMEKAEAVNALDEIIDAADGVMVARGDLGVELAPEWVPVLQKTIVRKANTVGKPVIIATQMLESMVHSPRPTRAETSDVANAILDGTDAVMLSAETAVGDYPVDAVQMMDRIARVVESSNPSIFGSHGLTQHSTTISLAHAAADLAHDGNARAIVAITRSGLTAQLLSKLRPHEPLIAFTEQEATVRRLGLWWGVQGFATAFMDNTDAMIAHLEDELLRRGLVEIGDTVTIVGSAPLVVCGRVNFVKMHRVRRPEA